MSETKVDTVPTGCEAASDTRKFGATCDAADDGNVLPLTPSHIIIESPWTRFHMCLTNRKMIKQRRISSQDRAWKCIYYHYWPLWGEYNLITLRELKNILVREYEYEKRRCSLRPFAIQRKII